MRTAIAMAGLLLLGAGVASAQLSAEELELELRSFDMVRETIASRYPYADRLDEAWHASADSLRNEVANAASRPVSRSLMQALAHSLGESHFEIIPEEAYGEIYEHDGPDSSRADGSNQPDGSVGIHLRWIEECLTVVRIDDPEAAAVVRPGDQVLAIDGFPTPELVALVSSSEGVARFETNVAIAAQSRLSGDLDEERVLRLLRLPGDTLEVTLPIQAWKGTPTKLGALPEQTVDTYSKDLGDVGVLGFSMFLAPETVMPFVQQSFEQFREKPGVVIDMRGNFGGLLPMIQGVVGWLVAEPTPLGQLKLRENDLTLFANPRPWRYEGKVAVLTDELSISAAELFTAAVQEAGLARVFGRRSAGLALPANVQRLPNGDGFLYVMADYRTPNGTRLERSGVVPDVEVPLTRVGLYADPDPTLRAALDWIRQG